MAYVYVSTVKPAKYGLFMGRTVLVLKTDSLQTCSMSSVIHDHSHPMKKLGRWKQVALTHGIIPLCISLDREKVVAT